MEQIVSFERCIFVLLSAAILAGQPPGPGGPPVPGGPPPPGGAEGVRRMLARMKSSGETADKLVALARTYLERSDQKESLTPFAASRYLSAADALAHAAEHQQHLTQKPAPPAPVKSELDRHLERTYFRLQQADYFKKESGDPNAQIIAEFAKQFYERALQSSSLPDLRAADECAKTTEDLVRALENLALATAPEPARKGRL